MATKRKTRRLGCEKLETREVMAGNVTASIVNGALELRGDSAANNVMIMRSTNGSFRVDGMGNTRINGSLATYFAPSKTEDDLRIFMNGGNDSVRIGEELFGGVAQIGYANVNMGTGSDRISLFNFKGNDLTNSVFQLGTSTDSSKDADVFATSGTNSFKGGVTISTGTGADRVDLSKMTVNGKLSVDLGAGDDRMDLLNVIFASSDFNGGIGNDDFEQIGGSKNGKYRNF